MENNFFLNMSKIVDYYRIIADGVWTLGAGFHLAVWSLRRHLSICQNCKCNRQDKNVHSTRHIWQKFDISVRTTNRTLSCVECIVPGSWSSIYTLKTGDFLSIYLYLNYLITFNKWHVFFPVVSKLTSQ